jgi:hypothetical protein
VKLLAIPRPISTVGLSLIVLAAPIVARAQQFPTARIGWLAPEPRPYAMAPFAGWPVGIPNWRPT